MAFITYRVSTSPTVPTVTTAKGLQLLNTEVDGNFKSLDFYKLETNGSAALLTGLPLSTGVTGILPVANGGTGSNTAATGTGGVVLSNSPTLVAPSLGVPAFIDLTNARNLPLDGAISVTGKLPIAFGGTNAIATPTAGAVPYGTGTAYAFTGVGSAGQVLTSAGAGTPTWTTVTTSAGGSNTQVQFNSSGSFAGSANMTFDGSKLVVAGQIESTATGFKFPDGTTQASAATGGGAWTKITAAVTATTKKQYVTDTIAGGAFIVTLPATPAAGDYVYFMDAGDWFTYNLTVARNGSTIEGLSSDLVLDVKGLMVQLIYDGSTWQVTSNIGPQGPIGPAGPAAGVGKIIAMAMIFGG